MKDLGSGLWNTQDVARYVQASRSWVYQKAEAGLLPSLRIGGLLRFDPAVIRAFVRGQSLPTGKK
jgi:excisionase family DNA binding protein